MNILGCLDTPTSGTYILNGKTSEMQDDELAEFVIKKLDFFSNVQLNAKNNGFG